MAGTAITSTGQDITGDFDLQARVTANGASAATIMKSMGSGSTDWIVVCELKPGESTFVKNTGTNAYKLAATITGLTVEFDQ